MDRTSSVRNVFLSGSTHCGLLGAFSIPYRLMGESVDEIKATLWITLNKLCIQKLKLLSREGSIL